MKDFKTLSAFTALFTGLVLITGCSSSDGGGGGGAVVPANAIVIDNANAEATVQSAASTADALGGTIGADVTQIMGLKSALEIVDPVLSNLTRNSNSGLATAVAFSESITCPNGGTASASGDESDDGTNYSESGSATFNNCGDQGFTINGSFSFSESGNYDTGAYTENASGSLTMTADGGSTQLSFTGFVFAETGNIQTGAYTTSQLTYAINFISNGAGSGGFLVTLTAPIIEEGDGGCPESGSILVTGANGTTAEGIYNGDDTMTIKANGEIVTSSTFCYY